MVQFQGSLMGCVQLRFVPALINLGDPVVFTAYFIHLRHVYTGSQPSEPDSTTTATSKDARDTIKQQKQA